MPILTFMGCLALQRLCQSNQAKLTQPLENASARRNHVETTPLAPTPP
jgi:hypothetical protein